MAEANSTTLTVSYTLTAGDILLVAIAHLQGASPTSVMWNTTEAMTKIETQLAGASLRATSLYMLLGGTSGTHNVTITFAASSVCAATAFGYSGPNLTYPYDGTAKNAVNDTAPNLTVTSPTGGLGIAVFGMGTGGTDITMMNGTKRNYQETANMCIAICDRAGQAGATQINGSVTGLSGGWSGVITNLNQPIPPAILVSCEA